MQLSIAIALLSLAAAAVTGTLAYRKLRSPQGRDATGGVVSKQQVDPNIATKNIAFRTEATEGIWTACLKYAFGVEQFDDQTLAAHAHIVKLVGEDVGDAAAQQRYFPRRPLLLPKLLQALNDTEKTRQDLVRLILEDPSLASETLKRANNAFYRMSEQPVESLDRAVLVLGTNGLRSLVSTAILQPVFRMPKGFFDRFGEIAWEHAQRSSAGAQAYAQATYDEDPFVAQLLGVLGSLSVLVLFRLTLDKYKQDPLVSPRPEVFMHVFRQHRGRLAADIARTWQLSEGSIEALDEQHRELSPSRMTQLGRSVYYGDLAASIAVATYHYLHPKQNATAILVDQGLSQAVADQVLSAADNADLAQ
jgi:HD-like signal output (HDOD) protein